MTLGEERYINPEYMLRSLTYKFGNLKMEETISQYGLPMSAYEVQRVNTTIDAIKCRKCDKMRFTIVFLRVKQKQAKVCINNQAYL